MAQKKFTVNTEPHEADLGTAKLYFKPEIMSDELLDAWIPLQAKLDDAREAIDGEATADVSRSDRLAEIRERGIKTTQALREFLAELMVPESVEIFNGLKLSDRVLIELERWLLEVYGIRPTGPSVGSSTPSDGTTTSPSSTDDSSIEAPTS